jgi:hypothetical protein
LTFNVTLSTAHTPSGYSKMRHPAREMIGPASPLRYHTFALVTRSLFGAWIG